jgi:SAM-dependent methyltransferase
LEDPHAKYYRAYDYAAGTHGHRRRLFRFSHSSRFATARDLLAAGPASRVLDYGSGDGYLLGLLLPDVPAANLIALEPIDFLREQIRQRFGEGIPIVESTAGLANGSFDRIACLEVLEHLQPDVVRATLGDLDRLLAPGGVLVVSVPIEVGVTALFKYIAAVVLTRMDRRYTFRELARATLGLPVRRDPTMKFLPHKGFDYREMRRLLSERFIIERQVYSPVAPLRGALNAQVIWKMRRRGETGGDPPA